MSVYGGDTHWRNSMKPARFFFLDARAAVPFVFTLLHLRLWTLAVAAITTLIFYILEQRGMSFDAALRAIRVWFVGNKRPNIQTSNRRRMVDYASEPWPEKFVDRPLDEAKETPEKTPKTAATNKAAPSGAKKVIRGDAPQAAKSPRGAA
jgi:intracellular multiplication protein IcmT